MTFGEALEAAKRGQKIQRAGWNGRGMYVIYVPEDVGGVPSNMIQFATPGTMTTTAAYLVLRAVNPPGTEGLYFVPGWLASQTDLLAEDWGVVP